jgi:DNA polymerase
MPKRLNPAPDQRALALPADRDQSAAPLVPDKHTLPALSAAASRCLACALGPPATQTVFGEGPADARLILIGEQPGDDEDRKGRPFVGPAGKLLDKALAAAGVARERVYVTNAVKHFSFVYRGKRRLHAKPHVRYVRACAPWLDAELDAVSADVIVCLGATAAQALLGPRFALTRSRGQVQAHASGKRVLATYHPSAALRAPAGRGSRARVGAGQLGFGSAPGTRAGRRRAASGAPGTNVVCPSARCSASASNGAYTLMSLSKYT